MKTSRLIDSFSGSALDTTKWNATGTPVVSNRRLKLDGQLWAKDRYDLTGDRIFSKVEPDIDPTLVLAFTVIVGVTDKLEINLSNGTLASVMVRNAEPTETSTEFDADNHLWWQIRESNGIAFWETSRTGRFGSWEALRVEEHRLNLTSVGFRVTLVNPATASGYGGSNYGEGSYGG